MTELKKGMFYKDGRFAASATELGCSLSADEARANTIAYGILEAHNSSDEKGRLSIRFDALTSHDITYVGIIQNARIAGLDRFPVPYILTNCHNSLCAVGGTINEDDHAYGLSAAKKYGGIYVPPHVAVIHQYMREKYAGCGKMILGSDSHTRYGALGCMAVGEGGPELVKQVLSHTYDIAAPEVIAVELTGKVRHGVGPQDVALAIIGAVYENGFVMNKVMEFVGDGIGSLSVDFRNGIDVMTTETKCLSSVWLTDERVRDYLKEFGRADDYRQLAPRGCAYYDGVVTVDLSAVEPMIALPFHPSNVYTIKDFSANARDICAQLDKTTSEQFGRSMELAAHAENGRFRTTQGVIAGCAGGIYENICAAAQILKGKGIGCDFSLSVYPSSQSTYYSLVRNGAISALMGSGASVRTAFCGPCFGAGDVPANNVLSLRHTTRNFLNREGSKPGEGQLAAVALMDARSIAATALNGGVLTGADTVEYSEHIPEFRHEESVYANRVYNGWGAPQPQTELVKGPNITDYPEMKPLPDHLLLKMCAVIKDPVTTTDELIPSGETSSLRSNPLKLAQFTLSRKAPDFVSQTKDVSRSEEFRSAFTAARMMVGNGTEIGAGCVIYARKPGDGSAREQAASSQRVLGTLANIAAEYATKRYRSNLINWGMLPFVATTSDFAVGEHIFIPNIRKGLLEGADTFAAFVISKGQTRRITLSLPSLTAEERAVILDGSLINHYKNS